MRTKDEEDWRCEGRDVMAGWWQTPAVSLPVRLRRPAWRTTAARALPAELMAPLSLILQLITSARSSLMKESPHRDETRLESRRRKRARVWESERKRKIALWEQENRLRRDRRRSDTWREKLGGRASKREQGKNKTLCERKGGRRWGPSLKMCARSLWSLVLVNHIPAVLLFKVKYIHKLIKLPVMINVMEGERYYGTPATLSINVTHTSWHSKCKTPNNFI